MTDTIESTAFFVVDQEARIVRGRLLPYGELSRRSITTDPVKFARGTVELPEDPAILTLNREHSQVHPIGRGVQITEEDGGVDVAFQIAKGKDGDQALADIAAGKFKRLSAEVRDFVRNGEDAVRAVLTGGALVPEGAFASAGLFQLADGELEQVDQAVTEAAAAEGITDPELIERIASAVVEKLEQTSDDPVEETTQEGAFAMGNALVPTGVVSPVTPQDDLSAASLFTALTRKDADALHRYGSTAADMFAISTIQHSGPSSVTIGADVQEPQYLGELWTRKRYERKYIPLISQATLGSMKAYGWQWVPGSEPVVAAYAGNTAEIPSNAVDTRQVTADAVRLAGGHKLDRRFLDFPDQGLIESYFQHMTESYAKVSDTAALAAMVAGATALTDSVAPGTGITSGLKAIVTGALAVIAADNTPSFAVVSPELWAPIVLTPNDSVLGYLNAAFGLDEGNVGGFKIIPGAVGTGKVLVGAKEAFTFFELPGSPIRVEGIDPHHGAIDPALFGYYATIVNQTTALQLVTAYVAP